MSTKSDPKDMLIDSLWTNKTNRFMSGWYSYMSNRTSKFFPKAPIVRAKTTINWIFSLSRYYSVVLWQKHYYQNKTYSVDKMMNCWNWDCMYTANWHLLTTWDKYISVACDSQYLWKKLFLEWIWEVTCNDIWWSIHGNRIDMWCGIWDDALDNRDQCPTWIRKGYFIK